MKFACLVYFSEQDIAAMTHEEWKALNVECFEGVERLQNNGHYLGGQPLQPTDTARTLRVREGQVLLKDGPFAETKEQLAGFYLLEARDMQEAEQLAARIPPARFGSIEIRPTRELSDLIGPR